MSRLTYATRALGLCALAAATGTVADTPEYALDYMDDERTRPLTNIRALAQDEAGLIWVGTESGLFRFDGLQFDPVEPEFGHGVVTTINIDSLGRIWTAWYTKPVTVYDPAANSWTTLDIELPRILPLGFLETPDGEIWLSNGKALFKFDAEANATSPVLALGYEPARVGNQDLVWDDGIVWLTDANNIIGYDTRAEQISHSIAHGDGVVALLRSEQVLWSCHIHSVFRKQPGGTFELFYRNDEVRIHSCDIDADGSLWVGTRDSGAIRLRPGQVAQQFKHVPTEANTLPSNRILRIFADSQGQLWALSPGHVSLFDDGAFHNYRHDPGGLSTFTTNPSSQQILEVAAGVFWLSTNDERLARLSRLRARFQAAAPPVADQRARKPALDEHNRLWIGMIQGGLYRWDRRKDSWRNFSADSGDPASLRSSQVRAVLSASDGSVYAGSTAGLLSRFDETIEAWEHIVLGGSQPIFNLIELPDRRIVIGRQMGITVFDPVTRHAERFHLGELTHVRAIATSASGSLWIGTHEGDGLLEFDVDRGVVRRWPAFFADYNLFGIHEDVAGNVWVGTWGNGLFRFNPASEQLQHFTSADGLSARTIVAILPGLDSEVWVAGDHGLSRIRGCINDAYPCTPSIRSFGTEDGLRNDSFNTESFHRATDGTLFFGGDNGVDFFHPTSFADDAPPARLSLIGVTLNGSVLPRMDDSSSVDLPNDFGVLEIHFTVADLSNPFRNRYRYRFGNDQDWSELGSSNRIAFRNLRPGRHSLEIQGAGSGNGWSEETLKLRLSIAQPFYLTGWALSSYAGFLVLLLVVASQYRDHKSRAYASALKDEVEQRTAELKRMVLSKSEFYANVSHEVRTPLALIVSSAEQLQDEQPEAAREQLLDSIKRHSRSLTRYVDSLITIAELQSTLETGWGADDLLGRLRQLVDDFRPLAGTDRIELIEPTLDFINVRSQPNALDTIFSNLLINALKHAGPDGRIQILVEMSPEEVTVTIDDDGDGIAPELEETIFDRGVLHPEVGGFGIGLHLVKQTIISLSGEIHAGSSSSGGARFVVTLPLADDSLPMLQRSGAYRLEDLVETRGVANFEGAAGSGRRSAILVVEDDEELRQSICGILANEYEVTSVASAGAALESAREEMPDLVLCDAILPDFSGFDVLRQLKQDSMTDHIPVVMLTARVDEESRLRGLEERADAYLTKPCPREVLRTTLRNLLQDRRNIYRHAAMSAWSDIAPTDPHPRNAERDFSRRFIHEVAECYATTDCNAALLADRMAMSRRSLDRKVHQHFERSVTSLITEFRLRRAAELLSEGQRVGDVSSAVGFGSHAHFAAVFKKSFDCTPSDYRKRNGKS